MRLQILLALVIATTVLPPVAAAPGDIDSSFGIGGRALMPLGTISYDQARGAALQSDGKIVVVGDSFLAGGYSTEPTNLVVVRLNPDGSRDFSFGTGGIAVRRLSLSLITISCPHDTRRRGPARPSIGECRFWGGKWRRRLLKFAAPPPLQGVLHRCDVGSRHCSRPFLYWARWSPRGLPRRSAGGRFSAPRPAR